MIIQDTIKTEQFISWYEDMEEYVMIVDSNDQVRYLNEAALVRFGYNREDVKNLQLSSIVFIPENFRKKVRDKIKIEGKTKEGKTIGLQAHMAYARWEEETVLFILGKEVKEKILGNQQLISILDKLPYSVWTKNNTSFKERDRDNLELFFNKSNELFIIIDNDHKSTKINKAWESLGWCQEDITYKDILGLVHEEDREKIKSLLKTKDTQRACIIRQRCKDGSYRWISWHINYMQERGLFVAQGREINNEKQEIDQIEAVRAGIVIEEVKNKFLTSMSHEFKTPLNIIITAMQLMVENIKEYTLPEEMFNSVNKNIYSVKQNAFRLLRLVNNLIDTTQIGLDQYTLTLGSYDIIKVIEDITLASAPYIENKGITLTFDTEVEELEMICDADEIERIILNLLSNALKYTDNGGRIWVYIRENEDKLIVSIKDTGIGIQKDKVKVIFDRLRRAENGLIRRAEGSGMGLSLVKALIELHEGKIEARSKIGYGTEMIFELPIRKDPDGIKYLKVYEDEEELKMKKCKIEFSDIYDEK